ncbi:MAG TPA: M48 family metallopeptidase [Solirubrobacteraceae bacterium]|nr:M48 family metallopeptidase [Solirubrobacteraceae bacterium]
MGEGVDAATVRGPSLKGRFAAAIALAIGFYVLAIGLGGGLIALAALMVANGRFNVFLLITLVFLGGSILFAAFPRRRRFEPPGVRLDAGTQPRLFGLIREEAEAMGEEPPHEVYATMEVNAAVTQVGARRRVMIVGLPLMHLLSERGFRGVIAHELGHYAGGDTRLGPWIYRTREQIGRTVEALSEDDGDETWSQMAVRLPFIWYGRAFLRITNAISRRQEFAADAFAARSTGRDAHVEALRRVHAFAPVFDAYWQEDVVPVLRDGHRPPLSAGFALVTREDRMRAAADEYLERELAEGKTDPYDSHPSLAERIEAVRSLPAGEPDDSPSAAGLLADPAGLEHALTVFLFGDEAARELSPLDWDDVAGRIYIPFYEALAARWAWLLEGVTFGTLPHAVARMRENLPRVQREEAELSADEARELMAATLAAGGVLALRADGWEVSALPGRPVECVKGELVAVPHLAVGAARQDDFDRAQYERDIAELGIADVRLDAGVPVTTTEPETATA